MPFEILRNDITNMQADAIVNTANPMVEIGSGVDFGIHQKAGPELLEARKKIGVLHVGEAAVTPAFGLDAKYVIHVAGPSWQGGGYQEEVLLRRCYERALELAKQYGCQSVAFPLLSAGNYGFPNALALQIAVGVFGNFLMENEMQIYLVVFDRDAFVLSEKLFHSVASYIDETYIEEKLLDEYGLSDLPDTSKGKTPNVHRMHRRCKRSEYMQANEEAVFSSPCISAPPLMAPPGGDWETLLLDMDAGFSEVLLQLIDQTGKKDSYIYKKANIDRKLFSKIRTNKTYKPSKTTALAFAIALELDIEATRDLIARAGYALSHSSKFDIIVEYFILHRNYDIFELNEVLFAFDQPLLGA